MFSSTGNSPAQQVPAWKRLGLKLKQPAAASEPATGGPTSGVGHPSSSPGKRKLDAPPAANSTQVAKRPRRDETQTTPGRNGQGQLRKQKSVTFADTPTQHGNTAIGADSRTATPKKSKGPAKKKQPPPITDLKPALEYLRLWKTARDSWKFNKNHQSALIKHVFDADGIPATDIETFYDYIQDLKGFIRMRLRETALEIRTKDQSDGKAGFPKGTKDADVIQERYETILTRFLDAQQAGQKRKGFAEADYLATSEDGKLIIQRLVKRLRAELVLDGLSESGESGESGQTENSTTSSSTETIAANENNTTDTTNADKRVKEFNDGTGKRRRKLRTANMDDSSSESEAESDSETSSSGSSSSDESSDEEEEATAQQGNGYETSSSSSSSSSESGSDNESGDESD